MHGTFRTGRALAPEHRDIRAGRLLGEIAGLDPGEHLPTVTAETPTLIAIISPSEFGQMLDKVPPLAHKIMRGLAHIIREQSADEHV